MSSCSHWKQCTMSVSINRASVLLNRVSVSCKGRLTLAKKDIRLHQTEPLFEPNKAFVFVWNHFSCSLCVSTLQHFTTLHNTTQRYTTLYNTTLHYTRLHNNTQHYSKLHSIHHTTQHHISPHYTTLNNTTQHCTKLHTTRPHYYFLYRTEYQCVANRYTSLSIVQC